MRLFHLAATGLFLMTCVGAGATPRTVIDHDPMGVTIGSPPPVVGTAPTPTGGPQPLPVETVVPDPSLNQILVEALTPIAVATGNRMRTNERMRLVCYSNQGRPGGTIRLQRLREGAHGDYSLLQQSAAISDGRAKFIIVFHRSFLRAGQRRLSTRTVYLVSLKATLGHKRGGSEFIQTATVLSDDPAAFRSAGHDGD